MYPALPDDPADVGSFRQGTPLTRWALARYLVGRSLARAAGGSLLVLAVVLLGLAVVAEKVPGSAFLTVVLGVAAVMVLVLRWGLRAVVRRLTATAADPAVAQRLRRLVHDTHRDVLAELRRVGLPSHTLTLPLLALRLVGKRRQATLTRLRNFDVDHAVSAAHLDELHLLLRAAPGSAPAAGTVWPSSDAG